MSSQDSSPQKNSPLVRPKLSVERPYFERFYIYVLLFFIAFLCADLTLLSVRDLMMPKTAPPARPAKSELIIAKRSGFDRIVERNIFNADGIIPPALSGGDGDSGPENVPVPSQLPLVLIGTIVHANPGRSIATIEFKNLSKIVPYLPNDDMEGIAKLLKIERRRAIFRNLNNNRLEYIEMPKDMPISFGAKKEAISVSDNNVSISRTQRDQWLNNLPELLQQARAVPYAPNGKVEGFIILDIMPGSAYEKLGLKRNDIIGGVNGKKIDSADAAFKAYNDLKDSNSIALDITRGGSPVTLNFNVQ